MDSTSQRESPPGGGGNERTPTTETRAPTFHGFPNLPPELRIKIWKAACLPRTSNDHGIHSVTIDVVKEDREIEDMVIFDENLDGYDEEYEVESDDAGYVTLRALNRNNKRPTKCRTPTNGYKGSAHLWDAGLWTTCRESRNAIMEHLHIDEWLQVYNRKDEDTQPPWYMENFPSTIVPHKKDTRWRPIVVPRKDIFCISAPLRPLPRTLYGMKLLAPFLGQKNFTIIEDWNIAFKFDSSWNIDFPNDIRKMKRENSPRGLLSNWIEIFDHEVYPKLSLWIVDDTARWARDRSMRCDAVYRDGDAEYVEIDWFSLRGTVDGKTSPLQTFMFEFALLLGYLDEFEEDEPEFHLLARKDNEVPM